MANTYTQIHIHIVFAPKFRRAVLHKSWRPRLCEYITGIVQKYGHKMLQINGVEDHLHILIGMRPIQSLSKLMQQVKEDSAKWINEQQLTNSYFRWQQGYGAFSHSKSQVTRVIRYIENQELHHRKRTFRQEYIAMLKKFEIDFDEDYIFQPLV